jgi:hypothetical protein
MPRARAHARHHSLAEPAFGKVDVDVLGREAAIDSLQPSRPAGNREQARLLAGELGCLPLALDHG